MNTFHPASATAIALILATYASIVSAQDTENGEPSVRFTVGAIAAAGNSPFAADDDDVEGALVPYFSIAAGRFTFDLNGVSYSAYETDTSSAELLLAPRWVSADPADEPGLSALDRSTAAEAGLRLTHQFSAIELEAEYLVDVSDTHKGQELNVSASTGFPLGENTLLGLKVALSWNDANLATYRYGVREREATSLLAAYEVDAAITPSLGFELAHRLSPRVTLIGDVQAEFLPDEITSSPIVRRETLYSTFIGIAYDF